MSMRFVFSEHVSLGDALQEELGLTEELKGFVNYLGTNDLDSRGSSHYLEITAPFIGSYQLNELEAMINRIAGDRDLNGRYYIHFKGEYISIQVMFSKI